MSRVKHAAGPYTHQCHLFFFIIPYVCCVTSMVRTMNEYLIIISCSMLRVGCVVIYFYFKTIPHNIVVPCVLCVQAYHVPARSAVLLERGCPAGVNSLNK